MLIILLFLLSFNAHSSGYLSSYQKYAEKEHVFKSGCKYVFFDRAYSDSGRETDSTTVDGNVLALEYERGLSQNLSIGADLEYMVKGEYDEEYAGNLSHISNITSDTKGFKEPRLWGRYWFNHELSDDFDHAVNLSYQPKTLEVSNDKYASGRHEVRIDYLFAYRPNKIEISGEIFSAIYGKKRSQAGK